MKLLMFNMGSYTFQDTKEAIVSLGHDVDEMYYYFHDRFHDEFFSERIEKTLKRKKYDAIISINFFPLIATAAHEFDIPYISWSYDSPLAEQLTEYFHYSTNIIYLFDRSEVLDYQARGHKNVYHLPLAINVDRLKKICFSNEINKKYKSDISFVGKLYPLPLDDLLYCTDDYVKGYVEGLFQAQFRTYGYNFLEDAIPDSLIDSINESYAQFGPTSQLSKRGLAYAISSQITHIERTVLLESFADEHDVNFYTTENINSLSKVKIHGPVKYFSEMNAVFKNSALNLCPTHKCIESGIPLRSLDILGTGSVLFSNFQPELAEVFVDGEDVIMYESMEDAVCKADYYLQKRDLLAEIGKSGQMKAEKYFSYSDRVRQLLQF